MAIRDHLLLPNHYRSWFTIQHFIPHLFFDRIGLAEPFFGSQISWNYHYIFQNVWMVFREHKLTFRRILLWFTLELASCLCYLDPVDLRKSISGSEISRNQSFCIWYKKCIFANQKSMCVIRMKRKNQNKQPVWRNTWNICIASHSQSFPRRTFLVEIICRFVPKTQNLRTDKSVSNHEERIYNSICINSHMKYKYCTTFVNNIEWLSHLVLLSKVIQNWKFANQKYHFEWYKSINKFRNHYKLFLN